MLGRVDHSSGGDTVVVIKYSLPYSSRYTVWYRAVELTPRESFVHFVHYVQREPVESGMSSSTSRWSSEGGSLIHAKAG